MKRTIVFIFVLCITKLVAANELIITKSFTGGWFDPDKSGQGFLIEIIKNSGTKRALASWYTFDNDGNQYWLTGVGDIENQSIHFEMILTEGGQFGDNHDPSNITQTLWGDVTFTFTDCNNGSVSWQSDLPGFDSGSMPVIRNTNINNLSCTGGLYDELGDTLTEFELITPLITTGVDADANGKTKYEQRTDRIEYSVEIEDLPVGTYQLFVGNILKGDIPVISLNDGSTEGEIEFRDPVEPGKFLLDFNPQGEIIDIVQNDIVFLSSGEPVGGGNGNGTSPNAPPFGDSETEVYMVNTNVIPLGRAKTKLEQRPDRVDFQVELEDVPLGFYDFNFNGEMKGVIHVIQTPAGPEGELEFRNPVEANKILLDFNPFGQTLTINQGSTVLFTLDFPQSPGGNGGGNGGNQNLEIDLEFNNSGVDPDASGSVKYESRDSRKDFKVEVEDLNFGSYQLVVGGNIVETINVNSNKVELEFRDPVEPGKLPLNFDPLNQMIEIKQSEVVYLSVLLQ